MDAKLETMPSSSPLSTAYVKKYINFSWQHENDGGRMLIPFIEWMDGFDPYKSRNNRKSIFLRTATFLPKGFDKGNHSITFPNFYMKEIFFVR